MSDIVESAKSSMSAAVSRISWEAQKQLRVRSKQSEIDKLMTQRRQLLDDLAQVAMSLYQQGILPDQQLSRLSLFPLGRFRGFAQGLVIGRNELDMTHTERLREVV